MSTVDKRQTAIAEILRNPADQEFLHKGVSPSSNTLDKLAIFQKAEMEKWGPVALPPGMTLD